MKRIVFLVASLIASATAFGQVVTTPIDTSGSVMGQPIRPPVETPWVQTEVGEFSDPTAYVNMRNADVMYSKTIWRIIDLREKINHHLYFPQETRGTWRSFMQVILDAVEAGDLRIYTDEYCNIPYTKEELSNNLLERRTQLRYDPETGEIIGEEELLIPHTAKEILSYQVKEIWFFDKQRSKIEVRILALCPIMEVESGQNNDYPPRDGEEIDTEAVAAQTVKRRIGWVMYDELRPFLAKQEVFNVKNNAQRLSLDDVLTWKRQFSSYVYAEQNVYNERPINEYMMNFRDQKIESDRIINEIRLMEHDLWQF